MFLFISFLLFFTHHGEKMKIGILWQYWQASSGFVLRGFVQPPQQQESRALRLHDFFCKSNYISGNRVLKTGLMLMKLG
ncbi:hypothetical protein EBO34_01725 [Alteribacter keqinensis]|uniref:Uncharacterized protein n=1 Tax=Alteribacter keqinensis TaxID=2483800 RepID=A0A3M7TTD8_9BACI|nr:hypothetical protein EBO34_01725 [Alteribacter keqinensis]